MARALAVLGMVLVHFDLVVADEQGGPAWLAAFVTSLQGRAAGTFVVLAGIGASLGSARARSCGDPFERRAARRRLLARAGFLLVAGVLFMTVWTADILHFYAAYLVVGATLLYAPRRALLGAAAVAVAVGVGALVLLDWEARWDFATLEYRGLWTPTGFLRSWLFDGWNPVFPWVALYLFGMVVGRLDLGDARLRRRLGVGAAVVAVAAESLARVAAPQGVETEGFGALLATGSFPPTPGYVVAGTATALAVIAACCELTDRIPAALTRPLELAGRQALSLYVAHVLVGLGALEAAGMLGGQPRSVAALAAVAFFVLACAAALAWSRRFRHGPLEGLMRRVSA